MQNKRDSGQVRGLKVGNQDRWDSKRGMQDMYDVGQQGSRKVGRLEKGMQERRDAGNGRNSGLEGFRPEGYMKVL